MEVVNQDVVLRSEGGGGCRWGLSGWEVIAVAPCSLPMCRTLAPYMAEKHWCSLNTRNLCARHRCLITPEAPHVLLWLALPGPPQCSQREARSSQSRLGVNPGPGLAESETQGMGVSRPLGDSIFLFAK
jgi:hypothetical protein